MKSFYPEFYWHYRGLLIGNLRHIAFRFFQKRRVGWVQNQLISFGKNHHDAFEVLDVGSGEGEFGKQLCSSNHAVKITNLEPPFSSVRNKEVIQVDFLKWNTSRKFDVITFWESLEHVPDWAAYLLKAKDLLKKNGVILIEYPRNDSIEARMFKKNWFHLDIPRHLVHFTRNGLLRLLTHIGFTPIQAKSVLSIEYAPAGLYLSLINVLDYHKGTIIERQSNKYYHPLTSLLTPLFIFCFFIELFLCSIDQSPFDLIIARKQ